MLLFSTQINTIAAIRHSAVVGHTVILSQIDSIQESFYDLFNQRFRCIKNPVTDEHRYYANVAIGAHSKPSRVNPNFQCIVLLKESELSATPAPFLNRFEKYCITYDSLIRECMANLPPSMRIVLETAVDKVTHTAGRMFMVCQWQYYAVANILACFYRSTSLCKSLKLPIVFMDIERTQYHPCF